MKHFADQLLVVVMLANFVALATNRVSTVLRSAIAQGVILGLLPVVISGFSAHLLVIAAGNVAAKGIIIPLMLFRAIRRVEVSEDLQPFLGYTATLAAGGVATALAFLYAGRLPLLPEHQGLLFVPAAIATITTGFLLLTTRRKAVTQVIAYLILDNGIFLFGMLLTAAMPIMVEAAALLDLLVGIFVMGIIINHISREFSSIDTARLSTLRER